MSDRFDLEQQLLECWKLTDDIKLLAERDAPSTVFVALASVYEFKFEQLWQTFENLVKERQV